MGGSWQARSCSIFALLLTSQASADGDEAVVGMMAKHMLEGREFPLVFYGQNYGGGATVEASIAALYFAVFGMSSITLKAAGLTIFMGLLVMTYAFANKSFGARPALIAVSCLALADVRRVGVKDPRRTRVERLLRHGHLLRLLPHGAAMEPAAARQRTGERARLPDTRVLLGTSLRIQCLDSSDERGPCARRPHLLVESGPALEARRRRDRAGDRWGARHRASRGRSAIAGGPALFATIFQPGDGLLAPSIATLEENLRAAWEWIGPSVLHAASGSQQRHGTTGAVFRVSGTVLFVIALIAAARLLWAAVKHWTSRGAESTPAALPRSLVTTFVAVYLVVIGLIGPGANRLRYLCLSRPFWLLPSPC